MKEVKVIYSGRVQGVGFRYMVYHFATNRPIHGYVQNEANGTVLLVAEGKKEDLEQLVHNIRTGPHGSRIQHEKINWSVANETFDRFRIAYE